MATRSHEFLLAGDAATYDRWGFAYTEGDSEVTAYRPDSQHSEQRRGVSLADVEALHEFLGDVLDLARTDKDGA